MYKGLAVLVTDQEVIDRCLVLARQYDFQRAIKRSIADQGLAVDVARQYPDWITNGPQSAIYHYNLYSDWQQR